MVKAGYPQGYTTPSPYPGLTPPSLPLSMSLEHWSNDILMPPPPWGIAGRQAGNINRIYHSNDKMQRSQVATQRKEGNMEGGGRVAGSLHSGHKTGFVCPGSASLLCAHCAWQATGTEQWAEMERVGGKGKEAWHRHRNLRTRSVLRFSISIATHSHAAYASRDTIHAAAATAEQALLRKGTRKRRQGKASRQTDRGTDKETDSETGKQTVIQRESNRCRERATRN